MEVLPPPRYKMSYYRRTSLKELIVLLGKPDEKEPPMSGNTCIFFSKLAKKGLEKALGTCSPPCEISQRLK